MRVGDGGGGRAGVRVGASGLRRANAHVDGRLALVQERAEVARDEWPAAAVDGAARVARAAHRRAGEDETGRQLIAEARTARVLGTQVLDLEDVVERLAGDRRTGAGGAAGLEIGSGRAPAGGER